MDVHSSADRPNLAATRVVLRPLATPFPLGLLGLFFATTLLSGLQLGWVPTRDALRAHRRLRAERFPIAPHRRRSDGEALAALALYAALAFELEDAQRRTVLPTFRRGAGVVAMTGDLGAQVGRVEHEAGVRQHL